MSPPTSVTASAGSASMTASHVRAPSRSANRRSPSVASNRRERGVELAAAALPGERPRLGHAADAMCDLDELRELGDPRGKGNLLGAEVPGHPLPSHCSYAAPTASRTASGSRSSSASDRAISAWWSSIPSTSRWPETANSIPIRNRCSNGWPAPMVRRPVAAARTPRSGWVYLVDFNAMSSPNHLACSCASVWQPTLMSSAV